MFKITCLVAKQEKSFYLSNVSQDDVEQVATVLANNLSFDKQHTKPKVSFIVQVENAETPLFEYLGLEILTGDVENEQNSYRENLIKQGILTGVVHNFGNDDNENNTELYKFKVLEK